MRLLLIALILIHQWALAEIKPTSLNQESVFYSEAQRYELKQDDLYVFNSIQQISAAFKLSGDENVIIKPLYDNVPEPFNNIKAMIKKGYGVDIVWVDFGPDRIMKTNKGRDFGGTKFLGYRVQNSNAILVQGIDESGPDIMKTIAHELTHVMQHNEPKLYEILKKFNNHVTKDYKNQLFYQLNFTRKKSNIELSKEDFEDELIAYIVGDCGKQKSFWLSLAESIESLPSGSFERTKLDEPSEIIIKIFIKWNEVHKLKKAKDNN